MGSTATDPPLRLAAALARRALFCAKTSKQRMLAEEASEHDDEMKDFIVDDDDDEDGDASVRSASPSYSSSAETESEVDCTENENSVEHICASNIISTKRTRRPTVRYEDQVFSSPSFRKMLLCDIPKEEMQAALVDEDYSEDESAEDAYSDEEEEEDEEEGDRASR